MQDFYDGREMIIKAFKNKIIPLADESYSQYFEESDPDWIKNPEEFIKVKNNLSGLDDNFNANFNFKKVGQKTLLYLK